MVCPIGSFASVVDRRRGPRLHREEVNVVVSRRCSVELCGEETSITTEMAETGASATVVWDFSLEIRKEERRFIKPEKRFLLLPVSLFQSSKGQR